MNSYFLVPQKTNGCTNEIDFLEKIFHKVTLQETVCINGNIYVRCNPIIKDDIILFPYHFRRIIKNASSSMIRKTTYIVIPGY